MLKSVIKIILKTKSTEQKDFLNVKEPHFHLFILDLKKCHGMQCF